jgi:hypothetical protein
MRTFETLLKLTFFLSSLYFMAVRPFNSDHFLVFLVVSLVLGVVLFINKHSSYDYPHKPADFIVRKMEGTILALFSIAIYIILNA